MNNDFDIIIIGGGGAGLAAGIMAKQGAPASISGLREIASKDNPRRERYGSNNIV
jgi:succinate dehydrogenase/fumarate reductase flavoprotein subunit